ncbi:organic cation transporter protein [Drosophila grimshawi]|uniref:Cation transporter protein n=2 Tax=Drosophila grimshawi TaxID=7222 RepID=B4JYZ1_DROGR|nr:organic cation transporter protein [Drosophila grimshawi]EDV98606.1 cation transporter protein [Drosophila grimshawi]
MDFESVLEKCGSFGRYQFVLLALYGYTNILSSFHYFSQTIISFTPPHTCMPAVPHDVYAYQNNSSSGRCNYIQWDPVLLMNEEFKCESWQFERESGYESITTELEWVCDDAYKLAVGQSFFFVGSVLGTIFFGYLADRIGRLKACMLTTLTGAFGDFITSFVHSLPFFSAGRFIAGLSTDTQYILMYILVFEYLSPKRRTLGLNIVLAVFYCVGLMVSPWLAIWVGSWRNYLWAASLPALGVLCYPCLLFESAEWLLTKRQYERAAQCLRRIAKFNGRQVEENVFDDFITYYSKKMNEQQKTTSDTFMGMLRTPRLRKFTIILFIKSMIITVAFDILSRNMEGLGTSPFKLFSFTSITYLPAGLTIILFQNFIGRKGMACASLFVGAVITALTGFLVASFDPSEHSLLLALMVGLGRYGGVVAYDAEAQYAAEIIPTSVRGRGMSNIHVVGYAFGFFSSYIIFLGTFYKPLPSIFISLLMFIGAGLCLALPETVKKKLPQTLADGENFGKGENWYYFPCFGQRRKPTEETVVSVASIEKTCKTYIKENL